MTSKEIQSLNLGIDESDSKAVLSVETAIEWLAENTTLDMTDLENLPAAARLFISKFCEITSLQSGVSSESIEGLSQSFSTGNTTDMVWDLASNLLSSYLKSRVRFVAAEKRWN